MRRQRDRGKERKREREPLVPLPLPHACYCYSPVLFLGLPPSLLHSPLLLLASRSIWCFPFFRPKVASGGSCLSFLSPPHLDSDSAITFPVFYLEFFALKLIPATVGFSSNQPLPFSLSPLPHMLECKFKSTRPK